MIIEGSRPEKSVLPKRGKYAHRDEDLRTFARSMVELQERTGMRASARGYAYLLEQKGAINKDEFDWAEGLVLDCIKKSLLPVDFVKEEAARKFSGVEEPTEKTPVEHFTTLLDHIIRGGGYTPDWWEGEEFYIQMIAEKVDLVTLFAPTPKDIRLAASAGIQLEPICQNYHIPIANAKGWSSVLQRAAFARRFKEAESRGLKPVLLYCGDHDPDGLRISEALHANLEQIKGIYWKDGETGYDPENLIIKRIGLNFDFIERYDIPSIDNLITGSKKDLADPRHPNHKMAYVQDYISDYGVRKWEAQALIGRPLEAQQLCREAIEEFLGLDARKRFEEKQYAVMDDIVLYLKGCRADKAIQRLLGVA